MTEVRCIGQALVDCITRINPDTVLDEWAAVHVARGIDLSIGGDAVNETRLLSRLGHSVSLVCGLGDDLAGNILLSELDKAGVDLSSVDVDANRPTPITNLIINVDGSRISFNSDATLLKGYAPAAFVPEGTRIVSLASLFRAPLNQGEVVVSLVREAKKKGALVCADTKIPTFRQMELEDIREILPMVDYIFPNDKEARFFSGREDLSEAGAFFRDLGVANVIIKAGAEGCYAFSRDQDFHLPALPVEVVDGTGAGDNFVAGFLSGLLRGFSLYDCCCYGRACASECVRHVGAGAGPGSREQADRLFRTSVLPEGL